MFIAVLFSVAKTWKKLKWPSTDVASIHTHTHTHTHIYTHTMEYHSAIKKNKTMPFVATWVCLEIVILNAMIQKEKNKCHMLSHMWNRQYGTDELTE